MLEKISLEKLKKLNNVYIRKTIVTPVNFIIEEYIPGEGGYGFENNERYDFTNLFQLFNHIKKTR